MKIVLVIVGVVVGGIFIIIATNWTEGSAIASAKATVTSMLNDPSSAEFYNVRTVKDDLGVLVCGQVNAKNRLGGYVGRREFVYVDYIRHAIVLKDDNTWDFFKDHFQRCGVQKPAPFSIR